MDEESTNEEDFNMEEEYLESSFENLDFSAIEKDAISDKMDFEENCSNNTEIANFLSVEIKDKSDEDSFEYFSENLSSFSTAYPIMDSSDKFSSLKEIVKLCEPDMSEYYERLEKAYFVNECLPSITMENIAEVFKEEIGLRWIFHTGLQKFLGKINDEIPQSCSMTSIRSRSEIKPNNYTSFSKWKMEKVSIILQLYNGDFIVQYYKQHESLNYSLRKQLYCILVRYFMQNNIWLGRSDFPKITKLIKDEFPEEDEHYYYQPAGLIDNNPHGKLYARYINQISSWRAKLNGIYKNTNRRCNKNQKITLEENTSMLEGSTYDKDDVEFLKNNTCPWEIVESKWKKTFTARNEIIIKMKKMKELTDEFPLISNIKLGYILFSIDLKLKFPGNTFGDFHKEWKRFVCIILDHAFKKTQLEQYQTKSYEENEELGSIRCFQSIHHLLPPARFAVLEMKNGETLFKKGSKKQQLKEKNEKPRRPSIKDSKNSTLLICESGVNIKEEVQRFAELQQKKKIPFHPLMVLSLDRAGNPFKYYVFVDNFYLQTPNFIDCLRTYIISFFIFDLEYPQEGSRTCKFIAELFLNFKSNDPQVSTLIKDLKKDLK